MQIQRSLDQADTSRYLARARYMLAAVILTVVLLMPVILIRGLALQEQLDAIRVEVTDDDTWVVTQLEVEFLKLELEVAELRSAWASSAPEDVLQERLQDMYDRFDIFYSRVGTVANKIKSWAERPEDWSRSLRILDQLVEDRDRIAEILDEASGSAAEVPLDAIDAMMATTKQDVRELSVVTLANLSKQASDRRLHYIGELRALLLQTTALILLVALPSIVTWLLYRQIGVRAGTERRLTENLYRVFDAKPDAILLYGKDRKIRWMNMAASGLFGVEETDERIPHDLDAFFPGVQRMAREGEAHPLSGTETTESRTFRDIVRRAGGGTVAVEVTRVGLIAESGDDTTVLFIRDVSETQRALRALRRERRLAETEAERYQRFLAVMSHEMRSPLHAIIASLDLARQRPGAEAMADLHSIAMDAAQIALEEASAVLEIGRSEHEMRVTGPVVFLPGEIIGDLVELNGPAALSMGTKLLVEIEPGADGAILGLRPCFWHAASNLLSNAVKFTRDGTIRLRLSRKDDMLRVEVTDTGPGIAPEAQPLVFRDHYTRDPEPGGQRKGAGLGLGLFVAAVEAMSGQYGLDSELGKGSRFWFTFPAPLAEAPARAPVADADRAAAVPTDLRVLVVDDSRVNLTLIKQMFATLGLEADLAASGFEALAATRDKAYDLILMDLSMPDMDGFATAAAIRKAGASQKAAIVALTANILARDEVEKPGSAFDGLQLKPLRLDELRTWLASGRFTPRPVDAPALIDEGIAGDLVEMMPAPAIEPLLGALFNEALTLAGDLDGGATEGLAKRFHRVAGSAGMLGAGRLRALAIQAELDCQDSKHVPDAGFRTTWRQTITETSKAWAARLAEKTETAAATTER